jgi:CxxC-x17-CxxC domain-containing protein
MRDHNRENFRSRGRSNDRFGGREKRNFEGRSNFQNRDDKPMFDAVCDNCGKPCKVPFQPRNGKPVYCSDCFEKMGGQESSRPQGNNQMAEINQKLDRIIELLTPTKG